MDAFGAAAAALQFAVALLKSAQALDAILNGKSSEPVVTMKKLAQIAEGECDAFLTRFPDDSTPAVKDARIIAQQGKDVCGALLKKIAKMHPDKKNPKTLARALGTIMWSKDEVAELQRSLSDCMQALGWFLAQQDRATVVAALKDAEKALASQINARSDEILALHIKMSAQSDDRWSQVIQLANAENEKRSAQKKVRLLLDALAFPGMGQRYTEVSTADKSTFRWIFGGHENSGVDERHTEVSEADENSSVDERYSEVSEADESTFGSIYGWHENSGMDERHTEVNRADDGIFRWIFETHENSGMDERHTEVSEADENSSVDERYSEVSEADESTFGSIYGWHENSGMDERHTEVNRADDGIFRWIFETHENSGMDERHTEVSEADENSSVDDRFTRWLTSGNDVFHIMGKPGSGKSTLMKYVFENPATTEMLEQWADGKKLVQAACFFWKPGAVLQRTRMGLVRTLLHGIVVASHDVAKTLFPDIWDTVGIEEKVKISLSDAAIEKAFQRLVDGDNRSAGAELCCCFFIDGLDEYGDASNSIIQLVRELTRMTQNGTGWLKICASSREYPEITEKLAADEAHRLTLQDLTRGDITALVDRRLQETFPDDDVLKDMDLHMLRHTIIKEAEGVFLWVVLVLGIIDEEAELGTSVRELQNFVHAQHDDLDAFFETVVARIEKRNRQKAAILFQYTLRVATLGNSEYDIPVNSLFWYMFLLEHPTAEDSGDQDAVLVRYKQVCQSLPTGGGLSETAKRVKRCGAGLLTVAKKATIFQNREAERMRQTEMRDAPQYSTSWVVRLTHRSIHEFLTTLLTTRWKDAVSGFDTAGAYVRMLYAFQAPADWNVSLFVQLIPYFSLQVLTGPDCLGTERLHRNFQLVDAYVAREKEALGLFEKPHEIPFAVHSAAYFLCYEYLEWRRHKPHAQQELKGKHWSHFLHDRLISSPDDRLLPTIAQLLASGASILGIETSSDLLIPGSPWLDDQDPESPWLAVIRALVEVCEKRRWGGLEVFSEVVALFIQASDGTDDVLPMWVWLDEETVLVVMDGHVLAVKEQHVVRRLVWQQKPPVPPAFPRPAGEARPGTVSLAEVLAGLGVPGNAAALAAAREPAAARARRAEQLLSAESRKYLWLFAKTRFSYITYPDLD